MSSDQLQPPSAFQDLLVELATGFINQPVAQMDDTINKALGRIVEFFGAVSCSINQYSENFSRFTTHYRWLMAEQSLKRYGEAAMPDFARITPIHQQGLIFAAADISDLAEASELAAFMRSRGLAAIVTVPIFDEQQLFGFMSISWDKPQQLDPQIGGPLQLMGAIFINALNRKHKEETIQTLTAELEQRVVERTAQLMLANSQLRLEIEQRETAEQFLRHSQAQLRSILDSSPISMLVTTRSGNILYVNQITASLFHIDANNLQNYNIAEFYDDPADRIELLKNLDAQGYIKDSPLTIRNLDGTLRNGLVSSRPFQYAGESAFLVAIVDVTDLRRTQASEEAHRKLTEALLDSAMALTSTLQLDEVVKHILRSVHHVAPHDVANLMILEGDEALVLGSRNYVAGSLEYTLAAMRFPHRNYYVVAVIAESRQPVIIVDITNDPKFQRISEGPLLKGYLGVPIVVGQELIGVINLGSQTADFFTETHARYLKIFAIQAGIAIQNARLYDQAKTIAALEERQRLSRELHDSVTQTLFSANMVAEALPRVMAQDTPKALRYLQDLHQLTRGAMAEMRSLLIELRPDAIPRTELGVLMTQLCDVFTGKTQIEVVRTFNKQVILPPELQMVFYRVAQEALSNIVKHAEASHVQFDLFVADDFIEMRIRDDGQGFDLEQVPANHFGLTIMKERAATIQAEFSVISHGGRGTEICLKRYLSG